MTTTNASFAVVAPGAETENSPSFGRIATFTWPAMSYSKLSSIANKFGFETVVPQTGYTVAVARAVEIEAAAFKHGHYRRFARRIKDNVTELVQEVIIPAQDGEVRGTRETVARIVVTGNKYVIKPENEKGREWLEGEGAGANFDRRVQYELDTVPAGLVGQWADTVVTTDIKGMPLANRGHSFHILADRVSVFDAFMDEMIAASNKAEQVFIAKTVDNSPETMASLLRSMRANLDRAIEAAQEAAAKATTKRGINGAVERLLKHQDVLGSYMTLFGAEGQALVDLLNKAADGLTTAEVIKEYGALAN